MSVDNINERLLRLEISEKAINEKLDDHKGKFMQLSDQLSDISEKQSEIFSMIQATKWMAFGCISMILLQNFGLIEFLKRFFP